MLERCVHKILALPRLPDAVVATGDLTDHGSVEEYELLAELLAPLRMPVYLVVGNHDDPHALQNVFPQHEYLAGEDGFVQYAVDDFRRAAGGARHDGARCSRAASCARDGCSGWTAH